MFYSWREQIKEQAAVSTKELVTRTSLSKTFEMKFPHAFTLKEI